MTQKNEALETRLSIIEYIPTYSPTAQNMDILQKHRIDSENIYASPAPQPEKKSRPEDYIIRPHIDGYVKLGNERSLAGTELFYPLSWNGEYLSFADIRFVADEHDNREGNFGMGLRRVPEGKDYMYGVYGFFDRKRSSFDNYFSQATLGAEFMTEKLDLRANGYKAISGAKTTGESTNTTINFVGTGVALDQTRSITKETPLSGFDVEAGYKLPFFDDARLYGGMFHFRAKNAESLTGVRTRVRVNVTDWLQLEAEQKYDNIRGANRFIQARIRIPFGKKPKPRQEPKGIYARLDERVIRDIDIVTEKNAQKNILAKNAGVIDDSTGNTLLVRHVDNKAAAGGDGSAENPHNTLAAAQAAGGANETIYVHTGDGTTTGQSSGVTLDDVGQRLIGSGSNLTLNDLGVSVAGVSQNTILIAKSIAPIITNTAGTAVTVTADNVTVAGLHIDKPTTHGINVSNADNTTIKGNTITEVGDFGGENAIHAIYSAAGTYGLTLKGNNITNAYQDGIYIQTTGTAVVNASLNNNMVKNNGRYGVYMYGTQNAIINGTLTSNNVNENSSYGVYMLAQNDSALTGLLEKNIITGTKNNGFGVYVNDDSTLVMNADLGGGALGSLGENSIYNNRLQDIRLDLNGLELKAENNWWGTELGLTAAETLLEVGSTIDTTPHLLTTP